MSAVVLLDSGPLGLLSNPSAEAESLIPRVFARCSPDPTYSRSAWRCHWGLLRCQSPPAQGRHENSHRRQLVTTDSHPMFFTLFAGLFAGGAKKHDLLLREVDHGGWVGYLAVEQRPGKKQLLRASCPFPLTIRLSASSISSITSMRISRPPSASTTSQGSAAVRNSSSFQNAEVAHWTPLPHRSGARFPPRFQQAAMAS